MTYPRQLNQFNTFKAAAALLSEADFIGSSRIIVPNYLGSCCRIRKQSGGAEQDIGFSAGVIDSTAVLAFAGGANQCTAMRVYNQLVPGNADFANVPTSANGSVIVDGTGTYIPKFGAFMINQSGDTLNLPARSIARTALTIFIGADTTLSLGLGQHLWFWGTAPSTFPNFKFYRSAGVATWFCHVLNDTIFKSVGRSMTLNGGGSYQNIWATLSGINNATPTVDVLVDGVAQAVNNNGVYIPVASFPSNNILSVQGVAGASGDSGLKLRDILLWYRALNSLEIQIVNDHLVTLPGA